MLSILKVLAVVVITYMLELSHEFPAVGTQKAFIAFKKCGLFPHLVVNMFYSDATYPCWFTQGTNTALNRNRICLNKACFAGEKCFQVVIQCVIT